MGIKNLHAQLKSVGRRNVDVRTLNGPDERKRIVINVWDVSTASLKRSISISLSGDNLLCGCWVNFNPMNGKFIAGFQTDMDGCLTMVEVDVDTEEVVRSKTMIPGGDSDSVKLFIVPPLSILM